MDIVFTFLTSTITGLITYFLGKKKANAEIENTLLSNLEKSVSIYQIIIDDLREQVVDMNKKINELETKVDELLKENSELKRMLENERIN